MNNIKISFGDNFFKENFGINYLYKADFMDNFESMMNLDILDSMLSNTNVWNSHNFIMMLDQKQINFSDYTSISLDMSGQNFRPDVSKVQKLVSRGASIILNDIQKYNRNLLNFVSELQKLTNGRCQGNLYFSMASHQAFGPHFDLHDVFAIHFEGEKVWNIYENIEKSPINHPSFKYNVEERRKRAGKIIDQVILKPGDLLYIPRGQYHDALASKNGAMHIAFGLTYFKMIDLMNSLWPNFILKEFMRNDIKKNLTDEEIKSLLGKLSNELDKIINSNDALHLAKQNIQNWQYEMKECSLRTIVSEGPTYFIDNSIKFEKSKNKSFLKSPKAIVEVPEKFEILIQFILKHETISENKIKNEFKNISNDIIDECIENLKKMNVIK
ncbi:cupin domain-containing protein [Alphaproteobacteria bacterium]|nr:cupin domain-containing protein [Alphaproteobacteria bacterium]